jgi:hypothetical protein
LIIPASPSSISTHGRTMPSIISSGKETVSIDPLALDLVLQPLCGHYLPRSLIYGLNKSTLVGDFQTVITVVSNVLSDWGAKEAISLTNWNDEVFCKPWQRCDDSGFRPQKDWIKYMHATGLSIQKLFTSASFV